MVLQAFFVCVFLNDIDTGHGNDVRTVAWHPTKGLLASGSRDTQQPVMLWDPRTDAALATL